MAGNERPLKNCASSVLWTLAYTSPNVRAIEEALKEIEIRKIEKSRSHLTKEELEEVRKMEEELEILRRRIGEEREKLVKKERQLNSFIKNRAVAEEQQEQERSCVVQ